MAGCSICGKTAVANGKCAGHATSFDYKEALNRDDPGQSECPVDGKVCDWTAHDTILWVCEKCGTSTKDPY